jgi:nucleoside 2-deoxyribosyltransferase
MQDIYKTKGHLLERQVAAVFRTLGAEVEHNVALAGNQIDIVARETTPSGSHLTIAIECKAYTRPVGVDVVNSFGALSYLLKQRHLIDRAVIVALTGFTTQGREAARAHDIELLEPADLLARVSKKKELFADNEQELEDEFRRAASAPGRPKRVFVVMPFAPEFQDVYILGIREVAERLGIIVERADDIEHNENILEIIQNRILASDAIVADTTGKNPNVLYELGFAHGLPKPTILLSRKDESIPFDLQSMNHIFYSSIVELRERLEKRLKETLRL